MSRLLHTSFSLKISHTSHSGLPGARLFPDISNQIAVDLAGWEEMQQEALAQCHALQNHLHRIFACSSLVMKTFLTVNLWLSKAARTPSHCGVEHVAQPDGLYIT